METLNQLFAAIDFSRIAVQTFPTIVNPIYHGFQSLGVVMFTSLKNIVEIHPGLISGTFFMSMVYAGYTLLPRPKRKVQYVKR
jgi:hypothetical protein